MVKKNRASTIFLLQVATFLTACSGTGSFLGSGSAKDKNKAGPAKASSVVESLVSDETRQLIVPADPETREEFVTLMDALRDAEMRASILDGELEQSTGILELAFMLDDDQFVDYVSEFNANYESLKTKSDESQSEVIRIGQEIADFMGSNYPAAVETLKEYAERFPPDDLVLLEIQKVRDTVLSDKTANSGGNEVKGSHNLLEFRLQQSASEDDKASIGHTGGVSVNAVVAVEVYANVAGAANVAAATNVVTLTNAAVVAEAVVCIVVAICPVVS